MRDPWGIRDLLGGGCSEGANLKKKISKKYKKSEKNYYFF